MKKGFLSLILLIAITCTLCIYVGASDSPAEEADDFVIMTEDGLMYKVSALHYTLNSNTDSSSDENDYLSGMTVLTIPAYTIEDEQRNMSTAELLNWFLQTEYVSQLRACSYSLNFFFENHEAFRELLSREDFIDTLEQAFSGNTVPYELAFIFGTDDVLEAVAEAFSNHPGEYTALRSVCSEQASSSTTTAAARTLSSNDDISYDLGGFVTTHDGLSVPYYIPSRDFTASEIADYNSDLSIYGGTRVAEPDATYNCHAYAWYHAKHLDAYWINSIQAFVNDSACTRLTASDTIQVGDIIVYMDSRHDLALHSGVVDSINSDGSPVIRSKWGAGGEYLHTVNQVPSTYLPGSYAYQVYYRYHNYTSSYNGNNYHKGNLHYFGYNKYCNTCAKIALSYYESGYCEGPPCYTPWGVSDDGIAA